MPHRIFGIAWNEDSTAPVYPLEQVNKIISEGHKLRDLATSFWAKIDLLPLGTRGMFLEKEIQAWRGENSIAGVPDELQMQAIKIKSSKNYEVEYAARRFNIDILTMQVGKCSCCYISIFKQRISSREIKEAGYSNSSVPNWHTYNATPRKFAYEKRSTGDFKYDSERAIMELEDHAAWAKLDPICTSCFEDIKKRQKPTFGMYLFL
jgi:hypothetical protein